MNKLIEGLNLPQQSAVQIIDGPVCVIAGAGSGKTSVLTKRIAYLLENNIHPGNILAITFTNKAAKEMKQRIQKIVGDKADIMTISTFHAFCSKILKTEISYTKHLKEKFTILDDDDQLGLVKDCMKYLNIDDKKFAPKSFLSFISNCKNNLKTFDDIEKDWNNENYIEVYKTYQQRLETNNSCDFDDLLFYTVKLLEENNDVLKRYQNRFKYISIDEYQDTNPAQYALANMLAKHHRNLFVVGDVDQAIYGFRNSDYKNILNFKKDYPDAQIIKLEQNYRSTKTILSAANEVISNNSQRIDKKLWTSNLKESLIHYAELYNDKYEASWVLDNIEKEKLYNKRSYKDISILIRTNVQSHAFEEALIRRGIPYNLVGAKKFYDRKEIKDCMAFLKVIYNPNDIIALSRIINVPKRSIGDTSFSRFSAYCSNNHLGFFEAVDSLVNNGEIKTIMPKKAQESLIDFKGKMQEIKENNSDELYIKMLKLMETVGYFKDLANDFEKAEISKIRTENLYTLINVAKTFRNKENERTIENFIDHISLISDTDTMKDKDDKVTIMTCHASKGLEFPVVFVVGFEENIFPSWQALLKEKMGIIDGIEEERRLCYVAITRAKEQLYLSNATERSSFGKTTMNSRSRFFDEIPEYLVEEEENYSPNIL